MKILISRHNGIGDVISLVPFACSYFMRGHSVSIMTSYENTEWLKELLLSYDIPVIPEDSFLPNDTRASISGFDIYLNFNRIQCVDSLSNGLGCYNVNIYNFFMSALAYLNGLEPPDHFDLNLWTCYRKPKSEKIYYYQSSSRPSRSLTSNIIRAIKQKYPSAQELPQCKNRLELLSLISTSALIIGPDSGPLHMAEATGTHWIGFMTIADKERRYKYNKYGTCIQSKATCSPCFLHEGCANPHCINTFEL